PPSIQAKILRPPRAIPDRYIVQLEADEADQRLAGGRAARASTLARELTSHLGGAEVLHVYTHVLDGFAVRLTEAQMEKLAADPRVKRIEQDSQVRLSSGQFTQGSAPWHLDLLDRGAVLGDYNTTYQYTHTGAGVHAYIIDSGILTTHPDFGGRASYAYSNIDDNGDTLPDNNDCSGHGTHVAGILGGATYGVAKGVTLHAVRVLGCNGNGSTIGVTQGVDWVAANRINPAVANVSLGGLSPLLSEAVASAIATGVTFVIAAGNGIEDLGPIDACGVDPAKVPAAITVSSVNSAKSRPYFANTGGCVDLFAPGVGVLSTWNTLDTVRCPNPGTAGAPTCTLDGTSMASPAVAGMAAIFLGWNRSPTVTPAVVAAALKGHARADASNVGPGSPNLLLYHLPFPFIRNEIIAGHSAKCIAISTFGGAGAGSLAIQVPCQDVVEQRFGFVTEAGVDYTLRTVVSSNASTLEVTGGSILARTTIAQYPYGPYDSQRWRFEQDSPGFFRIVVRHTGMCMTVRNGTTADGELLVQQPCDGSANQVFRVDRFDPSEDD
ncbi:S8 family serine peptidase, partial [Myxococcus sp. AM011]|uniref:S8 family serine peptidase n=1 Tax=Myxococcus sp. AM011 TaxID=2745200 RepID=UPI00159575BB